MSDYKQHLFFMRETARPLLCCAQHDTPVLPADFCSPVISQDHITSASCKASWCGWQWPRASGGGYVPQCPKQHLYCSSSKNRARRHYPPALCISPLGNCTPFQFSKEIIKLFSSGPREATYPEELCIPCSFQLRKDVQNLVNITQQLLPCGVV